jgi:hypothetical protein
MQVYPGRRGRPPTSSWIDEPLDFIMLIRIKDDGYAN